MSEFLMVVPEGWKEVPNADGFVALHGVEQVQTWVTSQLIDLDTALGDDGVLPPGRTLVDSRMFKDGPEHRIWYKDMQVPGYGG